MAICRIIETGATPEQYDRVSESLGVGDSPPPGASLHVAARSDDGTIRIVEVWDSRQQAEEFGEKVRAARQAAGADGNEPTITYLEVHKVIQA
jgi:alkanesulfonate monooxygenase SsuD/methylene tetrahydromethanopterin reductase-like flavin-dependent oxidoreductase (luciferase family)